MLDQADVLLTKPLRLRLHPLALGVATFSLPELVLRPLRQLTSDLLGPTLPALFEPLALTCHDDRPSRLPEFGGAQAVGDSPYGLPAATPEYAHGTGLLAERVTLFLRVNDVTRERRWSSCRSSGQSYKSSWGLRKGLTLLREVSLNEPPAALSACPHRRFAGLFTASSPILCRRRASQRSGAGTQTSLQATHGPMRAPFRGRTWPSRAMAGRSFRSCRACPGGAASERVFGPPDIFCTAPCSRSTRPYSRSTAPYSEVLAASIREYEAVLSEYGAVLRSAGRKHPRVRGRTRGVRRRTPKCWPQASESTRPYSRSTSAVLSKCWPQASESWPPASESTRPYSRSTAPYSRSTRPYSRSTRRAQVVDSPRYLAPPTGRHDRGRSSRGAAV